MRRGFWMAVVLVAGFAVTSPIATGTVHNAFAAADFPTSDGLFAGAGPVGFGLTTTLKVTGRGGVPSSGVSSVALNVTATNPTLGGFLTVWPSNQGRPTASNLNFTPGQTIPNMVVVPVSDTGQISIFNSAGTTDVIVDVLGWFPAGGSFSGLTPARLMDTRPGSPTSDGLFAGAGPVGFGLTTTLKVTGRGGVPSSGVSSVALNVTATNPTLGGFLTVWPSNQGRPTASNLNFTPGQTIPNMVVVPVSDTGQISIFNSAGTTDVIVDVLGWFPAGGSFSGLTPARLMDTRPGCGLQLGLSPIPSPSNLTARRATIAWPGLDVFWSPPCVPGAPPLTYQVFYREKSTVPWRASSSSLVALSDGRVWALITSSIQAGREYEISVQTVAAGRSSTPALVSARAYTFTCTTSYSFFSSVATHLFFDVTGISDLNGVQPPALSSTKVTGRLSGGGLTTPIYASGTVSHFLGGGVSFNLTTPLTPGTYRVEIMLGPLLFVFSGAACSTGLYVS